MRRLLLISLATIPLAGCQFLNRDGNTVVDVIESVESGEALEAIPNRVENIARGGGEEDAATEFEDPTVKGKETSVVTADLIKSTDPEERLKAAALSRPDPFANLVPPIGEPVVILPEPDPNSPAVARANSGASASAGTNAASNNRPAPAVSAEPTPPPVRVQAPNEPLVVPSPVATLPTIPQPVIAPTVSVSGVIQLGNEPYAILRSGNEPERYVRVGDVIAGGSVRVKRIETLAFEPRVILEENGIEVPRPVVSGGEVEDPEAEPVASIPSDGSTNGDLASTGQLPTAAVFSAPVSPTTSDVVPSAPRRFDTRIDVRSQAGEVPDSLLLSPASSDLQAVIPGFFVGA